VLDDQEEGKKQTILPTEERKGCAHTNMAMEVSNGRCSKNLTPKFKPSTLGKGGQRENRKTWKAIWGRNLISLTMLLMLNHAMLGK
jgi:hypothetical protein